MLIKWEIKYEPIKWIIKWMKKCLFKLMETIKM